MEVVFLLPLLLRPLVVILLLQVPHRRPAVLLEVLLVLCRERRGGENSTGTTGTPLHPAPATAHLLTWPSCPGGTCGRRCCSWCRCDGGTSRRAGRRSGTGRDGARVRAATAWTTGEAEGIRPIPPWTSETVLSARTAPSPGAAGPLCVASPSTACPPSPAGTGSCPTLSYLSQLQEHEHVPIDVHHHLCCLHQTGDGVLLCGGTHGVRGRLERGDNGSTALPPSLGTGWGGHRPAAVAPTHR